MWINSKEHTAVGAYLEAVRKQAGLTQAVVAKRLGKPQSFVSSYESGQRRIDLLELSRIAKALDHDVRELAAGLLEQIVGATERKRGLKHRR